MITGFIKLSKVKPLFKVVNALVALPVKREFSRIAVATQSIGKPGKTARKRLSVGGVKTNNPARSQGMKNGGR